MERKSDPRTCRILHWVADYAKTRQYNGYCVKCAEGGFTMMNRYPCTIAGEGLFQFATLEEVIEHFFRLAGKSFNLDTETMNAFRVAMWDERDGGKFFFHPAWRDVDAAMESAS